MSIQSLQNNLDALAEYITKGVFRKDLGKLAAQEITYTFKQMYDELQHHYFGSGSGGTAIFAVKANKEGGQRAGKASSGKTWLKVLENYCNDALVALEREHLNDAGNFLISKSSGKLIVTAFRENATAAKLYGDSDPRAGKGIGANPYDTLGKVRSKALNDLTAKSQDYRELFWNGGLLEGYEAPDGTAGTLAARKYSMGLAINLGHITGVSERQASALGGLLEGDLEGPQFNESATEGQREQAAEDWKAVEEVKRRYVAELQGHTLGVDRDDQAIAFDISTKKPITILNVDRIKLVGEGSVINIVGKDKAQKKEERAFNTLTGQGIRDIQNAIREFYAGKDYLRMPGSKTPVEKVRDSFINIPKVRALAKGPALRNARKGTPTPKTQLTADFGQQKIQTTSHKGVPQEPTKGKGKSRKGTKRPNAVASESGDNFLQLQVLLNAKLPRTVAENMGEPRLENRSGTFAGSVRVTDVTRTPQGFPSVGYTYRKNPYQVFEMGAGKAPWASNARDPRRLIELSMREIAQELAVGRFYTRRV